MGRAGRYREVYPPSTDPKAPSPLKVKEVWVEDRRYIVCKNEDQAQKDRQDREAIAAALQDALEAGDKSLVGNKGYRRFLKTTGEHFIIDQDKLAEEERYDGKWVLTTNTELATGEVALKYKQLWMVEDIFRSMKSLLETRPIYHKCDETIRGACVLLVPGAGAAQRTAGPGGAPWVEPGVGGHHPRSGPASRSRDEYPGEELPDAHRNEGNRRQGLPSLWCGASAAAPPGGSIVSP